MCRGERGDKGHVRDRTKAFTGLGDDELGGGNTGMFAIN
jgi:hypothetical protein